MFRVYLIILFVFIIPQSAITAKEAAFIVDIPFYCPPPKIIKVRDYIEKEYEKFDQKCKSNREKQKKHEKNVFKEKYFIKGKEPYRIAGKEFRGFLELYKYDPDNKRTPSSFKGNPRAKENAKNLEEKEDYFNLDEEITKINNYVSLFRNEAFGGSKEESHKRFHSSMRIVLLLNRYKSISSTLNKSLKRFNNNLDDDRDILLLRGFWQPEWEKKVSGRWKTILIKEVRHFFLEYLKYAPEDAIEFLLKNEENLLRKEFNSHVPYQELREAIRVHPVKREIVRELRTKDPDRPIYEAIHDNDLTHLRTTTDGSAYKGGQGLYTYYEDLIEEHSQPIMLSTGYRAAGDDRFEDANHFVCVFAAIEEDRYVRSSASRIDPRLAYYSEPNILVKISKKRTAIPYSFLDDPEQWDLGAKQYAFKKYAPHESVNILKGIYRKYDDPHIVFDPKHPVIMRLPDRMLYEKRRGGTLTRGQFDQRTSRIIPNKNDQDVKYLNIAANVSQSCLNFLDYARVLYSQLGLVGKKFTYEDEEGDSHQISNPNNFFNSIVHGLFTSYDPYAMVLELTLEGCSIEKAIRKVSNNYEDIANNKLIKEINTKNNFLNDIIEYILNPMEDVNQLDLLREHFNPIFQQSDLEKPIDLLIKAAKAMGRQRVDIIKEYYAEDIKSENKYIKLSDVNKKYISEIKDYPQESTERVQIDEFVKEYSSIKLKKLIKFLTKKGATQGTLASACGCSRTPIQNILRNKNVRNPDKLWENLIKNLRSLCKDLNINYKKTTISS